MEILVGRGECYEAERIIPISSVHLAGCNILTAGRAGAAFVKEIADKGGKFVVSADTNITSTANRRAQGYVTVHLPHELRAVSPDCPLCVVQ